MPEMTIQTLMSYPWTPRIEAIDATTVRLTVPPLTDFEIFGTHAEVDAEWREALESHLRGYLAVGKQVPIPRVILANETLGETSTVNRVEGETLMVRLDRNLQRVA